VSKKGYLGGSNLKKRAVIMLILGSWGGFKRLNFVFFLSFFCPFLCTFCFETIVMAKMWVAFLSQKKGVFKVVLGAFLAFCA
jgi:hypothetical protein